MQVPHSHVDDEYAFAGSRDPKICITTSRDPSSRLKQFMKEVKLIFPNSQAVNRGNTKVPELVEVRALEVRASLVCSVDLTLALLPPRLAGAMTSRTSSSSRRHVGSRTGCWCATCRSGRPRTSRCRTW
jgi:hypothetical protein